MQWPFTQTQHNNNFSFSHAQNEKVTYPSSSSSSAAAATATSNKCKMHHIREPVVPVCNEWSNKTNGQNEKSGILFSVASSRIEWETDRKEENKMKRKKTVYNFARKFFFSVFCIDEILVRKLRWTGHQAKANHHLDVYFALIARSMAITYTVHTHTKRANRKIVAHKAHST